MSGTTMNLRTASFSNAAMMVQKSSRAPPAEQLPLQDDFLGHPLVEQLLRDAQTLEHQILLIRKMAEERPLYPLLVHWFYTLPSNSCLRGALIKQLNNLSRNADIQDQFVSVIESCSTQEGTSSVVNTILRSLDNCHPAKEALSKCQRADMLTILAEAMNSDAILDPQVVRCALKLQLLDKSKPTGLLQSALNRLKNAEGSSSEALMNLSLLVVHELKALHDPSQFALIVEDWLSNPDGGIMAELSRLHLCFALLAALSDGDLIESNLWGVIVNFVDSFDTSSRQSAEIVAKCNTLQSCAHRILLYVRNAAAEGDHGHIDAQIRDICEKVEINVLSYLNFTSSDKVRFSAKCAMSTIVKIYRSCFTDLAECLVDKALALSWSSKTKLIVLDCIAKDGQAEWVFQKCPDIARILLDQLVQDSTVFRLCSSIYENLMIRSFSQTDLAVWIDRWVEPVFALEASFTFMVPFVKNWIQPLPALSQDILPAILTQDRLQRQDQVSCRITLVILQLHKQGKIQLKISADQCNAFLGKCLRHFHDKIRLQAFNVLISSQSSKALFTKTELDLIIASTDLNLNLAFPSDRQDFVNYFRKMLLRMSERLGERKFSPKTNWSDDEKWVSDYREFLSTIGTNLFGSFFPTASFSRRCVALECLALIWRIFDHSNLLDPLMLPTHALVLKDCLRDPYEDNRLIALNLLKQWPQQRVPVRNDQLLEEVQRLCSSHKPPDAVTASYLVQLLAIRSNEAELVQLQDKLLDILAQQVNLAKSCLVQASREGPMYGCLLCLRKLLSYTSSRGLVIQLIHHCYCIAELLAPVLNSDSTEGHLLCDYNDDDDDDQDSLERPESEAQLLCSWRSSKEGSLLLGEICSKFPHLLSPEEVLQMSDFFCKILYKIKHRGAFEQAYAGFCQVCRTMWTWNEDSEPNLRQSLLKLVDDTLGELTKPTAEFCLTRRSAGLPYLIQAAVSTEPEDTFPRLLIRTTKTLLHIGWGQQTDFLIHVFNILRVLYRDSRLGQALEPFVAEGVRLAIYGFQVGSSWSVRNSATLLFSALMTKIFGVKRSRDELSRKNAMTFRVFFMRFPSLYSFLLEQLKRACCTISKSQNSCMWSEELTIFPVLLILVKCQPSPLTEVQDKFKMRDFVPLIQYCCRSRVFKVRKLAAKCWVQVLQTACLPPPEDAFSINSQQSPNQLHGTLLQIKYYTQNLSDTDPFFESKEFTSIGCDLEKVCDGWTSCLVAKSLALDLLAFWMDRHSYNTLLDGLMERLMEQLDKNLPDSGHPWASIYTRSLANMVIQFAVTFNQAALNWSHLVLHPNVDIRQAALVHLSKDFGLKNQILPFEALMTSLCNKLDNEEVLPNVITACLASQELLTAEQHEKLLQILLDEIILPGMVHDSILSQSIRLSAQTISALLLVKPLSSQLDTLIQRLMSEMISILKMDPCLTEVRLSICEVVAAVFLRHSSIPDIWLTCWELLIILSLDEEQEIRESAYKVCQEASLVQCPDLNLNTGALMLESLAQKVLRDMPSAKTVNMLFQAVLVKEDESPASVAFDRNELNLWREEALWKKLIGNTIRQTQPDLFPEWVTLLQSIKT